MLDKQRGNITGLYPGSSDNSIINNLVGPNNLAPSVGNLHYLDPNNWPALVSDLSVDDTWELLDLSAFVPVGTKAVLCFVQINGDAAIGSGILCLRPYGATLNNVGIQFALRLYCAASGGNLRIGSIFPIMAPGGKFEYRRYSSVHPVAYVAFNLQGYYI